VHTIAAKDVMPNIPKGSVGRGRGHALHGNPPPPPPPRMSVSIEQRLATQNELESVVIQNEAHCGAGHPQHP
jgi:hypothetical protein